MNKFDVKQVINGDSIIGFTSTKEMKTQGWLDASKVSTYLMDDNGQSHKKHLGMITLFNTTHDVAVPFMKDLFADSAVLECMEDQSITYDLPVHRTKTVCHTAVDTSNKHEYPGIDEGTFEIILTREFSKGDILTYDPQYGQQVIVSSEHEIERDGENFKHRVLYSTNDKTAYFPKQHLTAGIAWMKVGHALAEYDTSFSAINMLRKPGGTITSEFILGSPRGVETFMTSKAAKMQSPGLNQFSDEMRESVNEQLDNMGGKHRERFFIAKKKGSEGMYANTMKVGTTLEYLALMELAMMETYQLLFARAATINSSNGVKRVNEGVWHQIRRGKIISYARPGAITLDHIHEASSYIYKNTKIEPKNRRIKFKGGWYAFQNVMQLFRSEAISQLGALPQGMLGDASQIKGPVFKGKLDELEMQAVLIKAVTFPGIGKVEIEHDASLDYQPLSDRFSSGLFGEGEAHTTHSLVIWDVTKPEYSNVSGKVKGADLVKGGAQAANIYYIKPEGSHVVYGYEQGRMANGGQSANVQSSLKYMGRQFWATSQSAALVLDTTRYIIIELKR